MAPIAYLARIELRRRALALGLLALLVAVIAGAVLTALAGARRTETAFDRYLAEVNPFDALVIAEGDGITGERVESLDSVRAAVGFRWYFIQPEGADPADFYPTFVPDDDRVPGTYFDSPVVRGRAPDPTEPLEIALGERTARRMGVDLGDDLHMESLTPDQIEQLEGPDAEFGGPDLTFRVVGIVRDPGDIGAREEDLTVTLLTPAFADEYEGRVGRFASGVMVDTEPTASRAELARELETVGPGELDSFLGRETVTQAVEPTLSSMAAGLRIAALVIALVGAVAIVQALGRLTAEAAGDHGALRSLGATRSMLVARLGLPAALAVGTGSVVGAVASVVASGALPYGVARRAEVDPGIRIDLPVLLLGLAAALTLLLGAVAAVALVAVARSERRAAGPSRPSVVADTAAGAGAPLPLVGGLRLALDAGRGARATPVRAAMGAAAVGAIGVTATFVFASSLHHAVATPSVYGWTWDAALTGSDSDQISDGTVDQETLAADPAFAAVAEMIRDLEVTVDGDPARAVALDDLHGHTPFVVVQGREPTGPDEVALGGDTLDELGAAVGDEVAVSAGGPDQPMEIVGVVTLPVSVDGGSSSTGVALTRSAADAAGFSGTCEGEVACSRMYALTGAPGGDVRTAGLRHTTEPEAVAIQLPSPPTEVSKLTAVESLPRLLAAALGLIAVLAVAHATTVTVRRRRRDLAVLRVLGFTGRDLRTTISVQTAVLALVGSAVGVVLGVVLGRLVWAAVADGLSFPLVVRLDARVLLAVPLALVGASQLGATGARRTAARVSAGQILRSE